MLNGVKNALMQVTYFLNGLMFNLLFYCHITLYWEKVTSYEKFNQTWKLYRKSQHFRRNYQNAEKWLNFQKFHDIFKTYYKGQTANCI